MTVMKLFAIPAVFAVVMLVTGCKDKPNDSGKGPPPPKAKHDHPTKGPNGGPFAEWGEEEYHVEFLANHDTQEATANVLGPDAKTYTPVAMEEIILTLKMTPPVTLKLLPKPRDGEKAGKSSRFVGKDPVIGKKMQFEGTLSGNVGKKPYSNDFKEEEDHDHDHKK